MPAFTCVQKNWFTEAEKLILNNANFYQKYYCPLLCYQLFLSQVNLKIAYRSPLSSKNQCNLIFEVEIQNFFDFGRDLGQKVLPIETSYIYTMYK